MKNLVFFASGSGTNFQSVIDAIEEGRLNARIAGLITNKNEAYCTKRAEKHNIPVKVLAPSDFESSGHFDEKLLEILEQWNPYLIILAGYLLKIANPVIEKYSGQIINIHPSLLPKYGGKGFYGKKVHEAVLKGGETETGCSVHIVTEQFDEGPILEQRKVPVYQTDTPEQLAARVLKQEHQLLPEVIANLIEDINYYT
ncbi:MAG TPA: phosphoribosylglycinamide formyltransferase [Balneolaceae bacterium]|nr:phosphoribosylglycinamide formyltransferase [Balneolaceae bacterium]